MVVPYIVKFVHSMFINRRASDRLALLKRALARKYRPRTSRCHMTQFSSNALSTSCFLNRQPTWPLLFAHKFFVFDQEKLFQPVKHGAVSLSLQVFPALFLTHASRLVWLGIPSGSCVFFSFLALSFASFAGLDKTTVNRCLHDAFCAN